MQSFKGSVGGGGCLAGFYDPSSRTALILVRYDTASDLVITKIASVPEGLPQHPVPSETNRGAKLGMTVAQVQAIEGAGTLSSKSGITTLYYNQDVNDSYGGTLYGHLAFLFVNDKAVAINAGGGH